MKIVIEVDEFQRAILDEVGAERFIKVLAGHNQEFKNGALFGLSWAGLLTAECYHYIVDEDETNA